MFSAPDLRNHLWQDRISTTPHIFFSIVTEQWTHSLSFKWDYWDMHLYVCEYVCVYIWTYWWKGMTGSRAGLGAVPRAPLARERTVHTEPRKGGSNWAMSPCSRYRSLPEVELSNIWFVLQLAKNEPEDTWTHCGHVKCLIKFSFLLCLFVILEPVWLSKETHNVIKLELFYCCLLFTSSIRYLVQDDLQLLNKNQIEYKIISYIKAIDRYGEWLMMMIHHWYNRMFWWVALGCGMSACSVTH